MTRKIYVVYCDGEEDPTAVCTDREVACQIAEYLEKQDEISHWVADLTISETLEDFIGD